MSFDRDQFKALVQLALTRLDPALCSPSAVNPLLGTAAQESRFGTYLRQVRGPAVGVFQMEPATFDWLKDRFTRNYRQLSRRSVEELEWDLSLAAVFARLRYRVVPSPLPNAGDVIALATYWKRYYNTPAGAGTVVTYAVDLAGEHRALVEDVAELEQADQGGGGGAQASGAGRGNRVAFHGCRSWWRRQGHDG